MKKTEIMNGISRTFHRAGFKLKKHSPEILVVSGIVGLVGSTVMACKATTELDDILKESKAKIDEIHYYSDPENQKELAKPYTQEAANKDLSLTYAKTAINLAKLYGPSIILGTLSITAILAGHNITRKRNVALAAAYTALDKGFKDYRGRVVERFGEALDKELKYGITSKEVQEVTVNEDGSESVTTKTIDVVDEHTIMNSPYSRFFDESCKGFTKDPVSNYDFLIDQQAYANRLLQTRGHLFLNEVYDLLGMARTQVGQRVGWIYDKDNPVGDNFVSFGIYDTHREGAERNQAFVNGYERVAILDFNVDGDILNMI